MANETTKQEQLEQWAEMKRACESRPKGMSVIEWCEQNGITKATYYYRLRELAKAGIGGKKRKSKSKQKKKKVAVIAAIPVVEENPTEVVTESPEVVGEEETPAEVMTEPAVEENPTEIVMETETTEASAEEETPVAEVAETTEIVTESAEEPAVEEVASVATSTSANTLDVTIGPAVIHVNDKTSPELLSKTILSIVSAMQTK